MKTRILTFSVMTVISAVGLSFFFAIKESEEIEKIAACEIFPKVKRTVTPGWRDSKRWDCE